MGEYSWANSKKILEITKRDEGVLIFKSHVRIIEGKKKKKTLYLLLSNKGIKGYFSKTMVNVVVRGTHFDCFFILLSNKDTSHYISKITLGKIVRVACI